MAIKKGKGAGKVLKAKVMSKVPKAINAKEPTGEEYLAENLELLTKISTETGRTIELMSAEIQKIKANRASLNALTLSAQEAADNIDYLTQKLGSVASHVIALEVVLAEIAPAAKLDMKSIVAKIRSKVAAGTDGKGDPAKAIDVATNLISKG